MTMVEKVARALARNMLTDLGKAAFDCNVNYYNFSFDSSEHKRLEAEARVAIGAMREPTEGMIEAGALVWVNADMEYEANTAYRAMIDAALNNVAPIK